MPDELTIDEAAGSVVDDQPVETGNAEPGDKEPLGDTPEPEPEIAEDGDEKVIDPDVDSKELDRREAQSAKDLRYELAKVREELAELKGVGAAKEPTAVDDSPPSIKEWYDTRLSSKAQKLIRQRDSGRISPEEAEDQFEEFKTELKDQRQLREDNHRIAQSMDYQRGESNVAVVRRTLASRGVKQGSLLEREVFRALKEDSGLDIKKPGTFATLTDAAKIARITAAYVKEEVSERQDKTKFKKVDQKSPLDKVRLNDNSPSVGRVEKTGLSWDETFEALKSGKPVS